MGAFSNLRARNLQSTVKSTGFVREAVQEGRRLWNQVFSGTSKEDGSTFPSVRNRNSWTRGAVSEPAAFKRLLQAMRSMAPGGWSDDRWEQEVRSFVGASYAAIHRKGMQLLNSEFQVFKKDPRSQDGKRPVTRKDPPEQGRPVPPYKLVELLERPNNDDSFGTWMYNSLMHMDLSGMFLTWMVPNMFGVPYEMYPIPTSIAIPQPAINPDYPDGYYRIQPVYPYGPFSSYPTPASAVGAPIPAQWMLRFKYPHPLLRYDGYSPQTALQLDLDTLKQMSKARFYSMLRVMNPSAVLNFDEMDGATPLPEAEIERIVAQFENEQQGPENFGRLFVAAPGSKLEQWTTALKDLEFQQGWNQEIDFILGAGFGITKPAAGMVEDSSYSTLFATLKQLHLLTLDPFCTLIGQGLTHHLAPFFGDDLIVEVRCKRIDDPELRDKVLSMLMQAKAITKNELRRAVDWPVTKEEWGEEMAGAEEQPEQPGGVPGMPGMPGGGGAEQPPQPGQPSAERASPAAQVPESQRSTVMPEPPEVSQTRPETGELGEGALGPRKALGRGLAKMLGDRRRFNAAVLASNARNGNGRHR